MLLDEFYVTLFDDKNHSRPQSRLVLLAAGSWARGPSGSPFPRAKASLAKRDRRLWGREWAKIQNSKTDH